jgi:hypothetical protein
MNVPVRCVAVVAAFVVTLSGCGSADPAPAGIASPAVVTEVVTAPAPTAVTVTSATTVTQEPVEKPMSVEPPAPAPAPAAATMAMPDVVCMNLQQAQDAIQDAGVFFSESTDASGRGRMQVNDSNWIVTKQSPAAGSDMSGVTPMLSAAKIGEPSTC